MKAAKLELLIEKNTDYSKAIVWNRGPIDGPYTPVDLTGTTARIQFRSPESELQTEIVSPTEIQIDPLTGTIILNLTKDKTALLTDFGNWDILVTFPGNLVKRPFGGLYRAFEGITQ